MPRRILRSASGALAMLLTLGLCGVGAEQARGEGSGLQAPGALHVYLNGTSGFFSDKGIAQAKEVMEKTLFNGGLVLTVDVLAHPPQGREVPKDEKQRGKFFLELARQLATEDKARGIYILVCRSPGYVQVIADKATRERGLSEADERKVRDILLEGFREAAKLEKEKPEQAVERRDKALVAAVQFVVEDLRNTTPPASSGGQRAGLPGPAQAVRELEGNSLAGWICIGLVALLALWLIVGFIRALSGMGSAPAAGGGGGGGFFSSLLGGLFGAMAGMWLYNHLFGGSSSWSGDSSGWGSTEAGSSGGVAGEGDFSGDTGAGGSFDTGDAGGGDVGGGDVGGGDWGGGDFGGGDFGGDGGGDF